MDYLDSLGVNAIELMPVMEFDGNDSWGYNPTFYFASDKAYGTPNDYKHFIDECHKRGIAVILDIVFNHCWGESPLAKMWWDDANNRPAENSPYANPVPKHEYNVGNDLNHESAATRKYFNTVLEYWMKEFHLDGYRFDLSKGLTQKNTLGNVSAWGQKDTSRINIIKDYQNTIVALDPDFYIILEHFANNDEEIILSNADMMLWGNMNHAFCQSAMGYDSESNFSGLMYSNRNWTKPNLVGFMESHDEERVGYKMLTWGSWNMATNANMRALRAGLSATFMLLAPGPKMMWQFGEMNYDINIDYNGRTGRKPVHWEYLDSEQGKYVHNAYSNILALRNHFPQMFSGLEGSFSYQISASLGVLRKYTYTSDKANIVLFGNFSKDTITTAVTLPSLPVGKQWYNYIAQEPVSMGESLTVAPHRFLILVDTLTPLVNEWYDLIVPVANEDVVVDKKSGLKIYPNPAKSEISLINSTEGQYEVYSMQGLCVLRGKVRKNGKISIGTLSEGMYLLKIGGESVKFIKQ